MSDGMDLRVLAEGTSRSSILVAKDIRVVPDEEGKHLQAVLSQHPCIQAKPLTPYQMSRKCLDSGIENNGLYSTCGLDTTADPQGFFLRLVLFNILMSLPTGEGKEGIWEEIAHTSIQVVNNTELWG